MNDLAQFKQLILQIERDLLEVAQLRTLLTTADATATDHLLELRALDARIKRAHRVTARRPQRESRRSVS